MSLGNVMPSHPVVTFDFAQAWMSLFKIILTYLLTLPVSTALQADAQ